MDTVIALKQEQFNRAIERYETTRGYVWVGYLTSFIIVGAQVILAAKALHQSTSAGIHLLLLVGSFVSADFINGLVHMYMDNNHRYTSLLGPLVASFHLHHHTTRYKEKPLIAV